MNRWRQQKMLQFMPIFPTGCHLFDLWRKKNKYAQGSRKKNWLRTPSHGYPREIMLHRSPPGLLTPQRPLFQKRKYPSPGTPATVNTQHKETLLHRSRGIEPQTSKLTHPLEPGYRTPNFHPPPTPWSRGIEPLTPPKSGYRTLNFILHLLKSGYRTPYFYHPITRHLESGYRTPDPPEVRVSNPKLPSSIRLPGSRGIEPQTPSKSGYRTPNFHPEPIHTLGAGVSNPRLPTLHAHPTTQPLEAGVSNPRLRPNPLHTW